ncbi:MAG: glycosyltransferase [Phycisphaerae bacterium]|nr:glycosyltransferase [Phycisphaerae bacterium]
MSHAEETYQQSDRPAVALITNHGYAGVDIPFGGAPDTGGQNLYVNSLARALDSLGYRVTIFARGGFPHFNGARGRREPEYLTGHVRYVFVPGGGDEFIRKEDIAIALDEELEWLDAFIRKEAAERGRPPWAMYEFMNTHYWDAAIIGTRLVERWRNDIAAKVIDELLACVLPAQKRERLTRERHWRALGEAPTHHLGHLFIENTGSPAMPLIERVRQAVVEYAKVAEVDKDAAVKEVMESAWEALGRVEDRMAPALHAIVVADAVGGAILRLFPQQAKWLISDLDIVDRHVWTPHSLGSLKQENFRDQPPEVCRPLKFCERRSHEEAVCARTRMFAATSGEIAERLRTHYGVPGERIFYFPPCADTAEFRVYADHETESTYRYLSELSGVEVEALRRGCVIFETSRMDQTKRKDLLLKAFAEVARRRKDVYLFIGGGPENAVYKSLEACRDAHPEMAGQAFLTGFIPEEHIGPLFSLAAMYVSASEMEGFGMSVLQAAASGTAVVASDLTPFVVQYVADDALVVHAGDVEGFARAMQRLLDDEADRWHRARRLLAKVKEFNWEAQTVNLLDHLRKRGYTIARGRKKK